ncbi:virulence factor family protein [Robbsia sp. Bb-Pol-6]|uniref:Virulence factor family protein n=1 Tax=Robbsia betulipollinis TaxID=2981849 RepID=A0ABT3ZM15_9BURK|nr:AcvB/VirJ family lysyl-phosphatidylglycerol hydrolase [Robbsia betulipollinis]MCY0387457.1 virulence factor family protein [Robbsia betulipollinis]
MAIFKNMLSTGRAGLTASLTTRLMGLSLLAGMVPAAHATGVTTTLDGRLYGDVVVAQPVGPMRAFVVLYSGGDGWQRGDQDAAELLARNGALVVGVNTPRYAAKLAATQENKLGCHYLVDDAEAISHQLQREAHSTRYFLPILAGVGQGGLLAERSLARAPANTLSGAIVLNAETQLDARFNPCVPDPTITHVKGFPGFIETGVIAGAGGTGPANKAGTVSSNVPLNAAVSAALNGAPAPRQFTKDTTEAQALLTLLKPHLSAPGAHDEEDLSDLPLIELPAAQPSDMLAIVISGDGGWRDLDKTIAESLQREGIPVVGIDALRYFWSAKTPEQTSHDVARVIQVYGARWHTRHIALVGYSFGASVMPFVYDRLPAPMRAEVSQLSLLGFGPMADFQIRVTGWLGLPASDKALPVLPETAHVPTALLQCFYGAEETETACPDLAKRGATVVKTTGGHHFGHDYDELAREIVTRWRAQIGTPAAGH